MDGETLASSQPQACVVFTINGVQRAVDGKISAGTSLNEYIRDHANLRGTKFMCLEGGCGACVVTATINGEAMAVNSCLVPVRICDGWAVETIEGIGDRRVGYHPVQARLARMNGSQCGYCSPGMVMNMYSLTKRHEKLTMKEIENSFGGNICRCTGYRPILDAFKSFASDADPKLVAKLRDIEELGQSGTCPRRGADCSASCSRNATDLVVNDPTYLHVRMEDADFYKVTTIAQLFQIFTDHPSDTYVLNGGNTAHGVYRVPKQRMYVDINGITDLHRVAMDRGCLTVGAGLSLNEAARIFLKYSSTAGFKYLEHLARHIDRVAHVAVRNIGTLAGNLMIKHDHPEFPSDVFLILETAGAQLHILESPDSKKSVGFWEFLEMNMDRRLIYSIVLLPLGSDHFYRSYKIMPTAQNAHAVINAGFLFKLDGGGNVLKRPNVIFGGVSKDFLHATNTEEFLIGKNLFSNETLQAALAILDREIRPDSSPTEHSAEYRKLLTQALFYKCVLNIKPDIVPVELRSGGTTLTRGLSTGKQDYQTDKNLWPINEPMPKLEAISQTSGEARYVNDLTTLPGEVFCAFVLTDVPNGQIVGIDASTALAMPGVVAFYDASDIPGENLFVTGRSEMIKITEDEPLFADRNVLYAGQPVGIVVAKTNSAAQEAVDKVKIVYAGVLEKKAVVTIEDAIASGDDSRFRTETSVKAESKGRDVKHVITGNFKCGGQYHYTMEVQSCVCVPADDGTMDVYSASQGTELIQIGIATCLGIHMSRLNVRVRRLGGAYGSKISRAGQIAAACALACHKLNRPTRFVMRMESNMSAIGKRSPVRQEYEVGVDDNGKIQYLESTIWANSGASFNESQLAVTAMNFSNCYDKLTWSYEMTEVRTDLPSNTWCRGPGSTDGIAMIESIMEQIARVLGKDPVDVRLANLSETDGTAIRELIADLKISSDYDARKNSIVEFNHGSVDGRVVTNRENRWKKRGISLVLMSFHTEYVGQYDAMVSIYARDGTVAISHGGVECGQGINTKVAQVAAWILGIDIDMISIKENEVFVAPNNVFTAASTTSESCVRATMMACKTLLDRLAPIKRSLGNPTWQELVLAAHHAQVSLCARYRFTISGNIRPYPVYGAAVAEVEVDALTGEHVVRRVDLIEDVGVSLSPLVDLGQIEGAYVMGMGYWTSEELIYDPETGVLLNDRSWNYKPPGAKDIPIDFRVSFRRNAGNPDGVLKSKATGEPAVSMSCGIPLAIRHALDSARFDAGNDDVWYNMHGPTTIEKILLASLTDRMQMTI